MGGEGLILFTASHEMTHMVEDGSPELWKAYADFIVENYVKQGTDVHGLVLKEMARHTKLNYEQAFREVIARASEGMLVDTHLNEKSKELYKQNRTLWEKIRDAFASLIARIRKAYSGAALQSEEARLIRQWDRETLEKAQEMWLEGVTAAARNLRNVEGAVDTQQMNMARYSEPISESDIQQLQRLAKASPKKSINDFSSEDIEKAEKWARVFYKQLGEKSPFFRAWFGDWRENDLSPVKVINITNTKYDTKTRYVLCRDMQKEGVKNSGIIKIDRTVFGDSLHYAGMNGDKNAVTKLLAHLDEIVSESILFDTRLSNNKANKKGNTTFIHKLYCPVEYNSAPFIAELTVEEYDFDNKMRAYNVQRIKMSALPRAHFSALRNDAKARKIRLQADEITVADLHALVKEYDEEFNPNPSSQVVDEDGKPLIVYHQTAKDFTVFNTDNPQAGLNDSETPNGIFFKTNDHDIGLEGKKQVACYLSIQKMLDFKDRTEANQWYRKNIDGYEDLDNEMKREVKRIEDNMDTIETNMFRDGVTDEEYDKLSKEWDGLLEEMRAIENDYRGRLRSLLNDYFLNGNGDYDGIHLGYDGHRYVNGKRENVETYIAFKNTKVKSATDNIGTFDKNNPDTRYQSRDNDFDIYDLLDDEDGSIESTFAKEYATHHEDIGEVLKNIADIDIDPKKVTSVINRVIRDIGRTDANARELLSTEIQIALERVDRADPETVVNEMIGAVRKAVAGTKVTDERAAENYRDLLSAFKGRKFYLTDEQISQLAEHDMTLNDFKNKMFGYGITIVSRENAKRSIDGGYADATELSLEGLYPITAA